MRDMHCLVCKVPLASSSRPPVGTKRHGGRGLCAPDYKRAKRRGDLADYPHVAWCGTRGEFLDDYAWLRDSGLDWHACAARMGISYDTFKRRMYRAREAGDPRARRIGEAA